MFKKDYCTHISKRKKNLTSHQLIQIKIYAFEMIYLIRGKINTCRKLDTCPQISQRDKTLSNIKAPISDLVLKVKSRKELQNQAFHKEYKHTQHIHTHTHIHIPCFFQMKMRVWEVVMVVLGGPGFESSSWNRGRGFGFKK